MLEENSIELSPLPIPTGAPAMPIKSCISANDVYIDVAAKKSDEEILLFQERLQRVFLLSNTVSLVVFIVLFKERWVIARRCPSIYWRLPASRGYGSAQYPER
jgi:hypothetical protein